MSSTSRSGRSGSLGAEEAGFPAFGRIVADDGRDGTAVKRLIVDMERLSIMHLISVLEQMPEGSLSPEVVLPGLAAKLHDAGLPSDVWVCMAFVAGDRCVMAIDWGWTPEAAWEATRRQLDAKWRARTRGRGSDPSSDRRLAARCGVT